jgi:uncharacterized oxidoreductase
MDLRDRRILITGGTAGIGLELARRLSERNQVVVAGRDAARLRQAVAAQPALRAVQLDVTSEVESRAVLAEVVERLGGLDILVNCAGMLGQVARSDAAAAAVVEAEVAVNLVGSMRMARLALPHLRIADDGAVVFLSSALALTAAPGLASYAATKAAVHSYARSLRAELAGQVRVFDVLPPFVDTALAAGFEGPKLAPDSVAADIIDGLRRDRFEIRVGRVNALARLARLWPAAADRIIARELSRTAVAAVAGADS